jgi:hypothetical protein
MPRGTFASLLLGKRAEDVKLDPEFEAAQRGIAGLTKLFESQADSTARETAARQDLAAGQEAIAAQQMAQASGARGFGQLAARRAAAANTAAGQAALGARGVGEVSRARAADLEAEERRRQALANLFAQRAGLGLQAQQLRQKQAGGGLLDVGLGLAGAAAGKPFGQAGRGFEIGQAAGETLESLFS